MRLGAVPVSVPCDGGVTIEYVRRSLSRSVAVRIMPLAVFLLVVTPWLFATGGELDDGDDPKMSSSVIDAQVFAVLPFTVTLTYFTLGVLAKVYFSELSVVPLLEPLNTFVNVVPSVDVAITKLEERSFPLYHAMSTMQMVLGAPRSAVIN